MDLWALRALVLDLNFETHGVPITVRPPDGEAIEDRGIWSLPESFDSPGGDLRRAARQKVLCVKRVVVTHTPRGAEIDAAEYPGAAIVTWTVDSIEREEADRVYLIVRRDPEVEP